MEPGIKRTREFRNHGVHTFKTGLRHIYWSLISKETYPCGREVVRKAHLVLGEASGLKVHNFIREGDKWVLLQNSELGISLEPHQWLEVARAMNDLWGGYAGRNTTP